MSHLIRDGVSDTADYELSRARAHAILAIRPMERSDDKRR